MTSFAAPAKLNLTLRVTGRRADGYHLLDSLVGFTDLGDTITATPADGLTLTIDGPFAATLGNGPDNLVLRAAEALRRHTARPTLPREGGGPDRESRSGGAGAAIVLTKRLPVASGIGGGSTDAAATLRALDELWQLGLADRTLAEIGLALGADLPVCLAARPVRMQGIGEQLTPLPGLAAADLVLVNPGLPLPTAKVFAARTGAFSAAFDPGPGAHDPADLARAGGNDLLAPARQLCPAIATVLAALENQPGCRAAALSGSGATCFGIFATGPAAAAAAARIRAAEPGWWVAQTRLAGA